VGVGNSAPLVFTDKGPHVTAALLSCLNSLVVDYCARTKVGGLHLNYLYLKQFPVLAPSAYGPADLAFIVPRVLELTYTSHSMAPFARDLGYDCTPFKWNEGCRAPTPRRARCLLRPRLWPHPRRAALYSRPRRREGRGLPSETFRVLKTSEIRRFGEYRTARLVLQTWDRLHKGELA
jgi:hypothetical protein